MSRDISGDVSLIHDEDVLRKMWQDTEDFGRKKEIRSHMYKLREARLKDFYNSGEVSTDIQKSSSTKTTRTQSKTEMPTHVASLADHSFISMKTKEIRDSESPTKDVNYGIIDKNLRNQGWNVVSSQQISADGKTVTSSKVATTSGSENIEKGKLDYAAKNEHHDTAFQDGDDQNFTKAVGSSSNSIIKQSACGGDDNHTFTSSSTKTSSSSHYAQEHQSKNHQSAPRSVSNDDYLVSRKTFTNNIPEDLKNHPNFVEGKTKVTQEIRNLSDGTTRTTTKYEIAGNTKSDSQVFSNQQQNQKTVDSRSTNTQFESSTDNFQSKIVSNENNERINNSNQTKVRQSEDVLLSRKTYTNNIPEDLKNHPSFVEGKTKVTQEVRSLPDGGTRTTTRYEIDASPKTDQQSYICSQNKTIQSNITKDNESTSSTHSSQFKTIANDNKKLSQKISSDYVSKNEDNLVSRKTYINNIPEDLKNHPSYVEGKTKITREVRTMPDGSTKTTTRYEIAGDTLKKENYSSSYASTSDIRSSDHRTHESKSDNLQKQTSLAKQVVQSETQKPIITTTVTREIDDYTDYQDRPSIKVTINNQNIKKKLDGTEPRSTSVEKPASDLPERPNYAKPKKSDLDQKPKATEGQYDTTYRTDYINRKISVEVSPTHNAFARSLRAISPDRISKCSSPSTNSLRSSTSPDKHQQSPERRSKTPQKHYQPDIDSSTLTRRKGKPRSRTSSPTTSASEIEFVRNTTDITTDLDTNITTISTKKVTDRSISTPINDTSKKSATATPRRGSLRTSPNKDKPSDRVLKRTDTYEERCREILGLTNETKKKTTSKKVTSAPKATPSKKFEVSPERKKPTTASEQLPKKSPEKEQSPRRKPAISEFPSQTRKSPSKEPLNQSKNQSPIKTNIHNIKEPSQTSTTEILEFPAQTRKSPEKSKTQKPDTSKIKENSPVHKNIVNLEDAITSDSEINITQSAKIMKFTPQIRKTPEKEPISQETLKKKQKDSDYPLPENQLSAVDNFIKIEKTSDQIIAQPGRKPAKNLPENKPAIVENFINTEKTVLSTENNTKRTTQVEKLSETKPVLNKKPEEVPKVSEVCSQARKSPEKKITEIRSISSKSPKNAPKSPEREPSKFPSQGKNLPKDEPKLPSQVRNTVAKKPLEKQIINYTKTESSDEELETPTRLDRQSLSRNLAKEQKYTTCRTATDEQQTKIENIDLLSQQTPDEIDSDSEEEIANVEQRSTTVDKIKTERSENIVTDSTKKNTVSSKTVTEHIKDIESFDKKTAVNNPKQPINEKTKQKDSTRKTSLQSVSDIDTVESLTTILKEENQLQDYETNTDDEQNVNSQKNQRPNNEKPKNKQTSETISKNTVKTYPSKTTYTEKDQEPKDNARKQPSLERITTTNKVTSVTKESVSNKTLSSDEEVNKNRTCVQKIENETKPSTVAKSEPQIRTDKNLTSTSETIIFTEEVDSKQPSKLPVDEEDSDEENITSCEETEEVVVLSETSDSKRVPSATVTLDKKVNSNKPSTKFGVEPQISPEETSRTKITKKILPVFETTERIPTAELSESPNSDEESEDNKTTYEEKTIISVAKQTSGKKPLPTSTSTIKPIADKNPKSKKAISETSTTSVTKFKTEKTTNVTKLATEPISSTRTNSPISKTTKVTKEISTRKIPKSSNKEEESDEEQRICKKTHNSLVKIDAPKQKSNKKPQTDEISRKNQSQERTVKRNLSRNEIKNVTTTTKQTLHSEEEIEEETVFTDTIRKPVSETKILTKKTPQDKSPSKPSLTLEVTTVTSSKTRQLSDEESENEVATISKKTVLTSASRKTPIAAPTAKKPTNVENLRSHVETVTIDKLKTDHKTKEASPRRSPTKKTPTTTPQLPDTLSKIRSPVKKEPITKKPIKSVPKEIIVEKRVSKVEAKIPVNEPLVTKKFINQLCKEDEHQRGSPCCRPKKNDAKTQDFIKNEQKDTVLRSKKPIDNNTITTTLKIDINKGKNLKKTSLYDIEDMNGTNESKTVHVRTHRVSDLKKKPLTKNDYDINETNKKHHLTTTTTNKETKLKKKTNTGATRIHSKTEELSSDEESIVDSLDGDYIEETSTTKTEKKTGKKCITTKSIVINNDSLKNREIIVDLQRSKSSREPTPDRICPLPVFSEDDKYPRYPDQISEPEEIKRPKSKISEIPIIEGEDVDNFSRVTELKSSSSESLVETADVSLLCINKKISKFSDATLTKNRQQGVAPKVERPNFNVEDNLKSDECLLSVSEKVNKFITTAEQLTAPQEFTSRPKSPRCKHYPEEKLPQSIESESKIKLQDRPKNKSPERIYSKEKTVSPERVLSTQALLAKAKTVYTPSEATPTPDRRSPPRRSKEKSFEQRHPKVPDFTPKSTRRPSDERPKTTLSSTNQLRSTETVRKARAIFEQDILSRPSVFEKKKTEKVEASRKLVYDNKDTKRTGNLRARSKSPESDVPGYMKPLDRSEVIQNRAKSPENNLLKHIKSEDKRSESPDVSIQKLEVSENDLPGYMRPLDRRSRSPDTITKKTKPSDNDSSKKIEPHTTSRKSPERFSRRSKTPEGNVPSYMKPLDRGPSRRSKSPEGLKQQNSQADNVTQYDSKKTNFGVVLKRTNSGRALPASPATSRVQTTEITEQTIEQTYNVVLLEQWLEICVDYEIRRKIRAQIRLAKKLTAENKLPNTTKTSSKTETVITTETKSFTKSRQSPEKRRSFDAETDGTKKLLVYSKQDEEETAAEWIRKRNLKKMSQKITSETSTKTSAHCKITNDITSSYGVGPTDENGSPLFGLKALKSGAKTDTKVQGTVIRSQYYSENGEDPVGEISVTKYSNDPRDLGRTDTSTTKGITSVTTTQKFGYEDTPSLKSLSEITSDSKTIQRRGSVKAISQKFADPIEGSKDSKQISYPKAGLILRTSSFKGTEGGSEHRESSVTQKNVAVKTTSSTTRTVTGDTFLTNQNRVTGVQDVISRMKTKDIREGDTTEDIEGRNLLNKFIGSQVILSGLEAKSSQNQSIKITTTTTEGGKPKTRTLVFEHPISEESLANLWDEETLRLLLEQSTDYEERRKIRGRLREVMAEQEACTELVDKATDDKVGSSFEETTVKRSFSKGPITTSEVTTKVTSQQQSVIKKQISPFAKFRQLDKQNSLGSTPSTPKTPSGSGPLFKFTDPAVSQSASTIKDRLLHWCRMKTKEYENIQLDNFSTSWADGLAFCALVHHFLPDSFDYHALSAKNRRYNFTLAFKVADEKADIAPLLDVDDMVATRKPDWKCVFTYVQSIYRRFKDED